MSPSWHCSLSGWAKALGHAIPPFFPVSGSLWLAPCHNLPPLAYNWGLCSWSRLAITGFIMLQYSTPPFGFLLRFSRLPDDLLLCTWAPFWLQFLLRNPNFPISWSLIPSGRLYHDPSFGGGCLSLGGAPVYICTFAHLLAELVLPALGDLMLPIFPLYPQTHTALLTVCTIFLDLTPVSSYTWTYH